MKLKQVKKQSTITDILKKHWLVVFAFLYFLSPVDLLPDVLPAIGFGDDVGVVLLSLLIEALKQKKQSYFGSGKTSSGKKDEEIVEAELVE